ncbi:hypothetical protein N9C44_01795 [bacterium]|nr:hypothetical protein [bacterium]
MKTIQSPSTGTKYVSPQELANNQIEHEQTIIKAVLKKFDILIDRVTNFATSESGIFKGIIVTGPPGTGKSFTIGNALAAVGKLLGKTIFQKITGDISAVGLYACLHKNNQKNRILWFDDCAGLLDNETCLEILKAVTNRTNEPRTVMWTKQRSKYFETNNIPNEFNYHGHIIISTNKSVMPADQTPKMRDHFGAIISRMPPTDLTLSREEGFIYTKYLIENGGMLDEKCVSLIGGYSAEVKTDTLEFLYENQDNIHEISPRQADAIAGFRHEYGPENGYEDRPEYWKDVAAEGIGMYLEGIADV